MESTPSRNSISTPDPSDPFLIVAARASVVANAVHSKVARSTLAIVTASNARMLSDALDSLQKTLQEQESELKKFIAKSRAASK